MIEMKTGTKNKKPVIIPISPSGGWRGKSKRNSIPSCPDCGTTKWNGCAGRCRPCGRVYYKAYQKSDKYKAYRKAYEKSDKYKASRKAYRKSDKYKAYRKAYRAAKWQPQI